MKIKKTLAFLFAGMMAVSMAACSAQGMPNENGGNEGSKLNKVPKHYAWTTTSHSSTDVNLYINGANIDFRNYSFGSNGRIKNTDVFKIMKGLMQGA